MNETTLLELDLLAEAVFRQYGYDLRNFARASLDRRLAAVCKREKVKNLSELQAKVLHDEKSFSRMLASVSGQAGELFRGPAFFRTFREQVVPLLRTYPSVRIWAPACGNGADAMGLALVLDEAGLLERARIYATDLSDEKIAKAESLTIAKTGFAAAEKAWRDAGGNAPLKKFFTPTKTGLKLKSGVAKSIFFAVHNLATDASFNEFNVVVARDVLIQFTPALQERAHAVFSDSLTRFGLLALGEGETLLYSPHRHRFETLDGARGFYRKVAP